MLKNTGREHKESPRQSSKRGKLRVMEKYKMIHSRSFPADGIWKEASPSSSVILTSWGVSVYSEQRLGHI